MAVLKAVDDGWTMQCPGCDMRHFLPGDRGWKFNGDWARPTFEPSFNISWGPTRRCHFVIQGGQIAYSGDSTHGLVNRSVPMIDMDAAPVPRPKRGWGKHIVLKGDYDGLQ